MLSVINIALMKMYSGLVAQSKVMDFADIFEWNLWPSILATFGMHAHLQLLCYKTIDVTKLGRVISQQF